MIEGHQRLISPILTRNTDESVNYGSICSIYLVRYAGSGAVVALLTRDNRPSGCRAPTRPTIRSGTCRSAYGIGAGKVAAEQ